MKRGALVTLKILIISFFGFILVYSYLSIITNFGKVAYGPTEGENGDFLSWQNCQGLFLAGAGIFIGKILSNLADSVYHGKWRSKSDG